MSIDVRIEGLDRLRRGVREAPKVIDRRRRGTLLKGATLVRDEARRRIHSPSGKARRGIRYQIVGDEKALIKPGNKAAVFAQRTRRPGQTPPSMRAARAIARQYGIPEQDARRIALAIAKRGTKGKPVMVPSLRATRGDVARLFRKELLELVTKAIVQ